MVARYRAALAQKWGSDAEADGAHDLAHVARVWHNAQDIAEGEVNWRVLGAAVWFHDVVSLPKDDPDRAAASRISADWAAAWLERDGMDAEDISAVHHAILSHSFSAGVRPETNEASILRDADRLDALGAIGLARTFAVSGNLKRALVHPEDPFAMDRDLDDTAFAVDHFFIKLLRLEEGMLTPNGLAIAKKRTDRLRQYLNWLAEEIGYELPDFA